MDEFEVLTSLYTPASDLALGDVTDADGEATFGRAGNDALRTYSPVAVNSQEQNVDYLFGDIFDNSDEEIEVFQSIQDGSDPLGILDIGPPSVGADRFILGDVNIPYYDDAITGTTSDDLFNNFFGLNNFSVIYDFNPEQDTIQLHGSPEDYLLVEIDGLPVAGVERPFFGEAIFQLKENQLDLVSYVISTPEVDLDLNDDNFEYVDGANAPSFEQAGQIGSPGVDVSYGSATDSEGNVYLTGTTSGALGGESQGGFDVWVAKYNSQGQELWRQQLGSNGGDRAYGIEIDGEDNVYLTGQTSGNLFGERNSPEADAWLAKLSGADGELIWGRQYGTDTTGGNSSGSFDLAVDEEGNVYASGLAIKESTLPPEEFDFTIEDDSFVIKFDTDGNQQWVTPIDTPFFNESYGIDVDNQGNVYTTGWTQGLVEESDPGRNLLKYDYWLATLDSDNGEIESTQQFNSNDNGIDFAWDTETDSEGNAYVSGWTTGDLAGNNGSYDPFLAKYNPDGTQEWVRQFGTGGDDAQFVASFDIDEENNIYVTGFTNSNLGGANQGDYDTWVVKYDSDGNQQWTQQLGTANRDYGTDVAANEFGEVFVTGFTNGSLGTASVGAEDAWVAKLDADTGSVENFANDTQGEVGVIGQEPEDNVEMPDDGQLSEEEIIDSLDEVFAPEEDGEFTEALGEAMNENSDELIFEDETGEELEEEEIDDIEGIEVDVQEDEGEIPDEEDTSTLEEEVVDTTEEDNTEDEAEASLDEEDTSTLEEEVVDADEDDIDEEAEALLDEENSTDEEQLSQEEITDSLDEVFAPEEDGEFTEALGEAMNENSDELIFEDETGEELEEEEIDDIEGIEVDVRDEGEIPDDEDNTEDEAEASLDEEDGTDGEQLSQEEITGSLDEVFASEEDGLIEPLEDSLSENSGELTFEDGTGEELEEEEVEEIRGIGNTPAADVVANTPAADVVANTPASI